MPLLPRAAVACLALALAALLAPAAAAPRRAPPVERDDAGADGGVARDDLRTAEGKVTGLDERARRVTIAGDGTVTLEYDRNTTVYLDHRLGTVRDVTTGAHVRAEYGDDRRAFWIEVHRPHDAGAEPPRPRGEDVPQIPAPPERPGMADAGAPDGGTAGAATDGGARLPPEPPSPEPPRGPEGNPPPGTPPTGGPATPTTPEPPPTGPGPVPGGPIRH